jgi:hypothetical protein
LRYFHFFLQFRTLLFLLLFFLLGLKGGVYWIISVSKIKKIYIIELKSRS